MGIVALSLTAAAELQTVEVGGQLQIRGSYWSSSFNPRVTPTLVGPELRIPAAQLRGRPIGDAIGGQNATSHWDWDSSGDDYKLVEERTLLNVQADFTDEVCAFIEIESFQAWGTDFRSNYITGVDIWPTAPTGVFLYQSYIEAKQMFGTPLRLRIGRQELNLGSGWLVGNNSAHPEFAGLSFDGIRATYDTDLFTVDAFVTKLAERSNVEQDGDIHFSGLYGAYKGFEDLTLDAYWLWLRDARHIDDNPGFFFNNLLEDLYGVDEYGATNLHTIGLRAATPSTTNSPATPNSATPSTVPGSLGPTWVARTSAEKTTATSVSGTGSAPLKNPKRASASAASSRTVSTAPSLTRSASYQTPGRSARVSALCRPSGCTSTSTWPTLKRLKRSGCRRACASVRFSYPWPGPSPSGPGNPKTPLVGKPVSRPLTTTPTTCSSKPAGTTSSPTTVLRTATIRTSTASSSAAAPTTATPTTSTSRPS
ncbi:MAG: alginate export family protein [Candidatus Hydrogenedentes bacterium]|nr:alginate export family protein [Candidatus Hydrogenedentota bacterium]